MKLIVAALIAFIITSIVMTAAFFRAYDTLTEEEPVAVIKFEEVNGESYSIAEMHHADGSLIGRYPTYGDQWRLDARFVKMKYLFIVAGFPSRYRLDRFEGRYSKTEDQNRLQKLSHDLSESSPIEDVRLMGLTPFADVEYGSSVYTDVSFNSLFRVYKSPTGLLVRTESLEKQAPDAEEPWYKSFW